MALSVRKIMDTSRRKFFGIGAAVAAAVAVPTGAVAVDKAVEEAVGPIMFEHVCDGGKSRWNPEDLAEYEKAFPGRKWGCGTRFRWYFGVPPVCPKCGWLYESRLEDLTSGVYKRIS